jgi:Putative prokaryotic signal transducing protein
MQQGDSSLKGQRIVVVHTAGSWAEAMVVRGLLESAGIASPVLGDGDPSALPDVTPFLHGIEIYALESEAQRARKLIEEYLEDTEQGPDESGEQG